MEVPHPLVPRPSLIQCSLAKMRLPEESNPEEKRTILLRGRRWGLIGVTGLSGSKSVYPGYIRIRVVQDCGL